MLYGYQVIAIGKISDIERCDVSIEHLRMNSYNHITELLKKYYFSLLENYYKKEIICSMSTDSVKLNIDYTKNEYTLTYLMISHTQDYFDMFCKVFTPDDFNLNFIIFNTESDANTLQKQIYKDIGIKQMIINQVAIQFQLLGCEENEVSYYGTSCLEYK
jgi:hypothetical protein